MPDETSMLRQWKLIRMLSARRYGLTIREMAREMNVGDRTIRRDLNLFRSVGFRLEETTGDRGCKTWQIAGEQGNPPLTFTFEEAAALYMGRQFLEPLAGTPFWSAAQSAWGKVRASLVKNVSEYLAQSPKFFHCNWFGHGDYAECGNPRRLDPRDRGAPLGPPDLRVEAGDRAGRSRRLSAHVGAAPESCST